MSKPRVGEGQDVRSGVIAAATRLFAARGFDGTSLQDIADIVGVTKPPDQTQRLLRGPVRPWLSAIAGYVQAGVERGNHPADLDPEAYVILALQMVTFTSAMGPVVSVAIEESDEGRKRYYREVARIAKAALFTPMAERAAAETGPHRARA